MATTIDPQKMIDSMHAQDIEAIQYGLNSDVWIMKINALWGACKIKDLSDELKSKIVSLQDDNLKYNGYAVSDFATAAMDILGLKKYTGDDDIRKGLIQVLSS